MLDNPRYAKRIANHSVDLEDQPLDRRVLVHIILGANEHVRICTQIRAQTTTRAAVRWLPWRVYSFQLGTYDARNRSWPQHWFPSRGCSERL